MCFIFLLSKAYEPTEYKPAQYSYTTTMASYYQPTASSYVQPKYRRAADGGYYSAEASIPSYGGYPAPPASYSNEAPAPYYAAAKAPAGYY